MLGACGCWWWVLEHPQHWEAGGTQHPQHWELGTIAILLMDPYGSAGAEGNALLPVFMPQSQGIPVATRLAGPFIKPLQFLSWISTGTAQ